MTSVSSVNASIFLGVMFSPRHRVLNSPKSMACISSLSVLSLNVSSLKKHPEDLEALVSSLQTPLVILVQPKRGCRKMIIQSFIVNGYISILSKNRDSKGGGVMVQITDKCAFQTTCKNMLEESLAVKIEKAGHFFSFSSNLQ